MLIEKSLKDYINVLSEGTPTPGGGSVSALAGSLASALLNMVGNLSFDKEAFLSLDKEKQEKIKEDFKELEQIQLELMNIVDEDAHAFDEVMKAFRMPKETEDEKFLRSQAIQKGYKVAIDVPFKCSYLCLKVLKMQESFLECANKTAITDVAVGALLAYAGLEGSMLNVRINLKSIKDEEYRKKVEETIDQMIILGRNNKDNVINKINSEL